MQVNEAARWAAGQLKSKGVEDPRYNADLLLSHVLGCARDRLYLERTAELTPEQEARFNALVWRRLQREPLQYILERQAFMGLDFYVDQRVLIPRADSEVLAEKLLAVAERRAKPESRILDVCTGSGALAIAIAYYWPDAEVVGTDISAEALEVAARNALAAGVRVTWRTGDLLAPAQGEHWDWIMCNPPYVSEPEYQACAPEILFEPRQALIGGVDGLDFYRRLAEDTQPFLAQGSRLLLEIGAGQAADVCVLWRKRGYRTEVFPDLAGRDRVVMVR
ncbi:MAG: peptide chain release factor N(5)-glutamine methyltransferase [Peptococcaceae bacterium]|jgi:release factor glutamine methyltransferase|nr:peptide chain release factor N(5)-glutamine methyltransferase [Peptococcaceae bacterium]